MEKEKQIKDQKEASWQDGDKNGQKAPRRRRSASFKLRKNARERSSVDMKLLSLRRVSRVVAGGRRFSVSVAVAVGDRQGRVGIGTGKGLDKPIAIEKATAQAQKNMVQVPVTKDGSIPCDATAKYCASIVSVQPSEGFVAGGAVRSIAELAGIKKINTKIISRSKNHLNNARATINALKKCKL